MNKLKEFIKKETVLTISGIIAIISVFIVPPSSAYIGYIDFRTLSLLLCLMTVMAGLSGLGVFSLLAAALLKRIGTVRSVALTLVLLCFLSSMLFTNDVALITFVPFAIETLGLAGRKKDIILTVAMQTVAANLGSMLTPVGNPQNLYLFGISGMSVGGFIMTMLPYTLISLAMILAVIPFFQKEKCKAQGSAKDRPDAVKTAVYLALFAVSLLTVARILDYRITLAIVVATVLLTDRRAFLRVDYSLLFTFIFFFVFIGNIGRIPAFSDWMRGIISGREIHVSILASQCMSNVPAAVLLSGFTENTRGLIIGTNLGGLGTLIASMASIISFKYIAVYDNKIKGRYFALFTLINISMLAVLWLAAVFIG